MYLSKEQLLLIYRAFGPENREYPDEQDEATAEVILKKVKDELYKRFGIIAD
ncbi:hypothetical protein P9314_05220 [Paenibacillus validus]|uniref:hypothetical protein n=1 Tax=Paenibacillus validus TaxID=44253 RepID=UPI0013E070AC|nr:hypothetical protein [Paenibacillus validus]MED4600110.1 hypothetical protein [Paenibacillus validus]MED4605558.1 hypothetical protein [Paenibacillus validus]